jgi:hypothetical protein
VKRPERRIAKARAGRQTKAGRKRAEANEEESSVGIKLEVCEKGLIITGLDRRVLFLSADREFLLPLLSA